MRKKTNLKTALIMAVFLVGIVSTATGGTIYVDVNTPDNNDGSSWAKAYKYLQDALAVAGDGNDIWVAEGTYKPDENTANPGGSGVREAKFQLINGVGIYGGFPSGGDPNWNDRDPNAYETILSGDLDGNDVQVADPRDLRNEPTRAENSYRVVSGSGTNATAVLDDFTITAGNANGLWPYGFGGGMFNGSGSPTVTNCSFSANSGIVQGGGMYNNPGSPTVTNCSFSGNSGDWSGGGMYNYDSSAMVTNCTFSGNTATMGIGGGMHNEFGIPTVTNCTFSGNYSTMGGGGMLNQNSSAMVTNCTFSGNSAGERGGGMLNVSSNSPTLTNCTFSGNSAWNGGGIFNWMESSPTLTNCTFSANSATNFGGGIFNWEESSPTLTNCIMWGNTAPYGPQICNVDMSSANVTYSDVQGGWGGTGNIDADPLFKDADANDFHLQSQAGRWDADSDTWVTDANTSPCIDGGDMASPVGFEPFPNGGRVNMGAYGGTWQASKSYFGTPVCETIVAGDINGDCKVDFKDFALMAFHWLEDNSP